MIKITAKSIVKAGAREEFIATARELVENSRAEAGNVSYHLSEDIDDPNILTFIEEWKDQAAVDVHADSDPRLGHGPDVEPQRTADRSRLLRK